MAFKKVTAVVDEFRLEAIEQALLSHGVSGFFIHSVEGRGHYFNPYKRDGLVDHAVISIYTTDSHAKAIAQMLMKAADLGIASEGLIAITSVDELYWIKENRPASEDELNYFEVDHD